MTHQAKLLQETMATVHKAYFASRPLGAIRVHEGNNNASISIDLYNFEGDGKDVCDGLEFTSLIMNNGTELHLKAFSIRYDPDDEKEPVIISCEDLDDDTHSYLPLNAIPDTTLANITTWLWDAVKQPEERSVWMRVGLTVKGTAEEIEALFNGDEHAREVFEKLMKNYQYEIDGNSYIPECCVDIYNEEYGTSHIVGDYDITP